MSKDRKSELETKLSKEAILFCEYIVLKKYSSHTECYKHAYLDKNGKPTKSDKVCASGASRTLRSVNIKAYIACLRENIEETLGIDKLWALGKLKSMVVDDTTDLYEDWIELKDFKKLKESNPELMKTIKSIDTKTEQVLRPNGPEDFEEVEVKYIKIQTYDKKAIIAEMGKMLDWYSPQKIDVSGTIDHGVAVEKLSKSARKEFMDNMKGGE